jgi:hypothetical protein
MRFTTTLMITSILRIFPLAATCAFFATVESHNNFDTERANGASRGSLSKVEGELIIRLTGMEKQHYGIS